MGRAPTFLEYLADLAFFLVANGLLPGVARIKSQHSAGLFRWGYCAPVTPLVALVCYLSWQWLFDVTAANLWPLAMFLYAIPCGILWLVIFVVEIRSRRVSQRSAVISRGL